MPAHIGFTGRLKILAGVIVANMSQSAKARKGREMSGGLISYKMISDVSERVRNQRMDEYVTYNTFRTALNRYDPDRARERGQIDKRSVTRTEWDMYLQPGTVFDQTCKQAYDANQGRLKMMLITHKSNLNALKRIEAIVNNGKPDIIWSDA